MKQLKYIVSAAFVLTPLVWLLTFSHDGTENPGMPEPTEIIFEEEGNERELREKWMETMHRAAPGTNWREMDAATRAAEFAALPPLHHAGKVAALDTFAGGKLIGEWKERGSENNSGRIVYADLDTAAGVLWAAADGGQIWHGTPAGTNWVPVNDQLKFNGIRFLRIVPLPAGKRVLTADYNRVRFSDDDGATWNTASGLDTLAWWGYIKKVVMVNDSPNTVYVLCHQWNYISWNAETAVYRSTDKGVSFSRTAGWSEAAGGGTWRFDIWTARYGTPDVYLLNDSNVYKLNTSGTPVLHSTFSADTTGTTLLGGMETAGRTFLYAYIRQHIYRSNDGGLNWTHQGNIGKNPFWDNSWQVSATDSNLVFFGDIECWRSTDGGANWAHINDWWTYYSSIEDQLHADMPAIISMLDGSGNEIEYICTDGGLYISDDYGATVQNLSLHGLNVSQYYSTYTHRWTSNTIYAGSQDQGFQRCNSDSGTVLGYNQIISGDYGHIVSGDGGFSLWTNYPGFTHYYANAVSGGPTASWDFVSSMPLWIPPLMNHPTSATKCYIAGGNTSGSGSHIIQLTYSGGSINALEYAYDFESASGGSYLTAMAYSPLDYDHWYALTENGKFFHSTDNGITWTMTASFSGPGPHWFYGASIHASRVTPGTVYIAGSGYSNPPVYRSTDHGATFTSISAGLPSTLVYDLTGDEGDNLLFAATEVGPYVYVKENNFWYALDAGKAPDQTYWSVDYVDLIKTARFGTYGRGIWDFRVDELLLNRPEVSGLPLHVRFAPNPCEGATTLLADAALAHPAHLEVFNETGGMVYSSTWEAGTAQFPLELGSQSAGLYFVRLRSGADEKVYKLVIAK